VTPLRQRLRRVPAPVVDAGLAVALAVANTIGIRVAHVAGARPDAFAYAYGLTIAALALARRRWPLAVLLASAATLQIYVANYTSTYRAIPLSVALATAWAAGHRRWSLLVAAWFVISPLAYALSQLPEETRTPLTLLGDAMSNAAMFAAVLVLGEAVRARRALQLEQERSERLLLNVLPAPIAARLKVGEGVIADAFPEVTVLFADIVDFTRRSRRISPAQVVQVLNELFSAFDQLAQQRGLEKIKTIGDAYMVAGGLPNPRPDHAEAVAEMALALREEVARRSDPSGQPLAVRVGMDTGPVVAGVIGTSKFSYDLWGNTVNTASRMESHGVPGCIQVTARTRKRLAQRHSKHIDGKVTERRLLRCRCSGSGAGRGARCRARSRRPPVPSTARRRPATARVPGRRGRAGSASDSS
jgi:class 3 adenylate cyclase